MLIHYTLLRFCLTLFQMEGWLAADEWNGKTPKPYSEEFDKGGFPSTIRPYYSDTTG